MTVLLKSGLTALVDSVRTYFEARNVTANVSIGWKEASKQVNQGAGRANRVVFIPSDPSGRGGKLVGAHQPGMRTFGSPTKDASVRALYTWERQLVVSVWAVATDAPNDEERQVEAVENLFEWTIRAVHAFAFVNAQWGDVNWLAAPIERQFGRELQAGLIFRHPMFDTPAEVVYPGLGPITKVLEGENEED